MANAKEFLEIAKQGYRFEKWCCDRFKILPSEFSSGMWLTYKITRKKYSYSKKTILDAYDPETGFEIEIKSTKKKTTFDAWKRGKTKWCQNSAPQKTHPDFLVIIGLVVNRKVLDWAVLRVQHKEGKETVIFLFTKKSLNKNKTIK